MISFVVQRSFPTTSVLALSQLFGVLCAYRTWHTRQKRPAKAQNVRRGTPVHRLCPYRSRLHAFESSVATGHAIQRGERVDVGKEQSAALSFSSVASTSSSRGRGGLQWLIMCCRMELECSGQVLVPTARMAAFFSCSYRRGGVMDFTCLGHRRTVLCTSWASSDASQALAYLKVPQCWHRLPIFSASKKQLPPVLVFHFR